MRKLMLLSVTVLVIAPGALALAGDAAAGKKLSSTCVGCHGVAGITTNPNWPNLAGQKKLYLVKQLKAFKSGERKDPTMNAITKALSVTDMENLAEYYSKMK